jgi:hypothetical protein
MSGRILRLKSTEFIQQPVFYKGFTARRQATLSLHSTECIWQLELSRQGKKRSALRDNMTHHYGSELSRQRKKICVEGSV